MGPASPISKSALRRRLPLHIKRLLSNKYPLPCVLVNHELPKLGILFFPYPGGRYSKKFYTGRVRLAEVRLLTLLYTIFYRKGIPIVYRLLKNGFLFTYLV